MKQGIFLLICIAFGTLMEGNAQTPVVDQRQQVQKARIADGVASGELSRQETKQSVRDQRRIRRTERRAKSDGAVTAGEKANLQRKQNKASRQLRRNKNQ